MIKAIVKKLDGTYLDHSNFASEEAAMEWLNPRIDKGIYGQKHTPAQFKSIEVVVEEAVLDEEGVELSPAVYETQQELVSEEKLAQFVIEFEDVEEISQEQANEEARAYLASTDWYVVRFAETGTPIPSDIVTARAAARASVVE